MPDLLREVAVELVPDLLTLLVLVGLSWLWGRRSERKRLAAREWAEVPGWVQVEGRRRRPVSWRRDGEDLVGVPNAGRVWRVAATLMDRPVTDSGGLKARPHRVSATLVTEDGRRATATVRLQRREADVWGDLLAAPAPPSSAKELRGDALFTGIGLLVIGGVVGVVFLFAALDDLGYLWFALGVGVVWVFAGLAFRQAAGVMEPPRRLLPAPDSAEHPPYATSGHQSP